MIARVPDLALVRRLVSTALPHQQVSHAELLSGGRINTNLKLTFSTGEPPAILRLHTKGPAACQKETQVIELIKSTVPVPQILYVDSHGFEGSGPFSIIEFVEGLTFQQLKRTGDLTAIRQAASSVGATLAVIGRYSFSKPGSLLVNTTNEIEVGEPFTRTADPVPEILDVFLEFDLVKRRLGTPRIQRLRDFVWAWSPYLPDLTKTHQLVHSDFGNRNILVNEVNGQWKVTAVLDWEFAFSGSPLLDVGNFLRYDPASEPLREPYFSRSFVEHGGELPDNWRQVVQVIDLTALVECLSHEYLPADVVNEILTLINATLDNCRV